MDSVRKKKILMGVIKEHIRTQNSVSSGSLANVIDVHCSPATIRSELAALENDGYLVQPHTSAGRIPTYKGYREYVKALTNISDLSKSEKEFFMQSNQVLFNSIENILNKAVEIVSELSDYAVIVSMPEANKTILKYLQLILISVHEVLFVMLSNTGKNKDVVLELDGIKLTQDELNELTKLFQEKLVGRSIEEISDEDFANIIERFPMYEKFLNKTIEVIIAGVRKQQEPELIIKNYSKLLEQPDFISVEQVRNVVDIIEKEKNLVKCLIQSEAGIQFLIGNEAQEECFEDLAMVKTKIELNHEDSAYMAILGPKRMDYAKSAAHLKSASEYIQKQVKNLNQGGGG